MTLPDLPPPHEPGLYRLALVCLGNICRSPMAHVVLEARLSEAGLDDRVHVRSAGTGGWHVGEPMDRRAAATLTGAGYDPSRHRGRRFVPEWFATTDLVLAMDSSNLRDLQDLQNRLGEPCTDAATSSESPTRLRRYRDLDPAATAATAATADAAAAAAAADRDVPDPYYGADDGFATVLAMVERTSESLVDALSAALSAGPGERPDLPGTSVPPSA